MSVKALRNQLLAAIAMVLVAALALSSSTFAWFAANNTVRGEGMKVQAKSEEGIVISLTKNGDKSTWKTVVDANQTTATALRPTDTKTAETWWHNVSTEFDDAQKNQTTGFTQVATSFTGTSTAENGVGYTENGTNSAFDAAEDSAYYLLQHFYIKSSSEAIASKPLYLHHIEAVSDGNNSDDLDKSLRVLVKVTRGSETKSFIYTPFGGDTEYYFIEADNTTFKRTASAEGDVKFCGKDNTDNWTVLNDIIVSNTNGIPANNTTDPIDVYVYVYFEGQDQNCKSSNIAATLDNTTIALQFGIAEQPANTTNP